LEICERETTSGGIKLIFRDGGIILCQYDDDPHYFLPEGTSAPSLIELEMDNLFDVPESKLHWWRHNGIAPFDTLDDIPDYYYECIDRIKMATGGRYSIHGEINSPFDTIFHFCSFEEILLGLLTNPDKIHELLAQAAYWSSIWGRSQVRRGCDAIKLSSPWAGSGFISRKHYTEFVLPYERIVIKAVQAEGGIIYTHTCGSIGDRFDLLISSGVDGLECLDPPPLGDVDLAEAKARWGDQVFIKGNIDSVNTLMHKSPEEVRAVVFECLRIGSKGGGYILSTACSVAPAVPPENLKVMVQVAREFPA
jgi:MtaA/CmuA family methyltransferase